MPDDRPVKITEPARKAAAVTDVDIMLESRIRPGLDAVMIELTRLDQNFERRIIARQDPLLVIVEIAAAALEVIAGCVRLQPDSRAILPISAVDRATGELD